MVTNLGSQPLKSVYRNKDIQNGDSRDHKTVPPQRPMGDLAGLQRCVFPHSNKSQVQEISKVLPKQTFQFTALPFGLATAPLEFTKVVKEVKLMAQARGIRIHQYLDDWLLRAPCQETCLRHTRPSWPVLRSGLGGQHAEIRADPSAGFQFCRLPVRPIDRSGLAHSRKMVDPPAEVTIAQDQGQLHSQTVHVFDRSTHSHRKAGLVRSPSYEAHSMAPEVTLARSGGVGKDYPIAKISTPAPGSVVRREKCHPGATAASRRPCSTDVYRSLKRRLGHTLRGLYCKRRLVRTRKSPPYKLSRVESSVPGPQGLRASLQGSDCVDSHGQHHCGFVHQQGGRYEIRLSMCRINCPPLETSVLVPSQGNSPEGKTHSRPLECNHGQIVQIQTSDTRSGPYLSRCSISCAPGGPGHKSTCLQPGTITNCLSLFHRYQIKQPGQWTP